MKLERDLEDKFKFWLRRELKEDVDQIDEVTIEDLSRLLPIEGYLKELTLLNVPLGGYCHLFLFNNTGILLREWDEMHHTPSLGEIDEICKEVE